MSNRNPLSNAIRHEYATKSLESILKEPITTLNGVSLAAAEALKSITINSVFDLATNSIFNNALKIYQSAFTDAGEFSKFNRLPADILDKSIEPKTAKEALSLQIESLVGIGADNADNNQSLQIKQALAVRTIGELSMWPAFSVAQEIVKKVYNPEKNPGFDTEAPEDLIPKNGSNPTEINYYSSLIMVPPRKKPLTAAEALRKLLDDKKLEQLLEDFYNKNSNAKEILTSLIYYWDKDGKYKAIETVLKKYPESLTYYLNVYTKNDLLSENFKNFIHRFLWYTRSGAEEENFTEISSSAMSISFDGKDSGIRKPMFGARITYSHAWYGQV